MRFLVATVLCFLSIALNAQYAFELEVEYSTQIGNTDNYSVSGNLLKGKIENGKKYYLTSGAEFKVMNLMSATTATSVSKTVAPQRVSVGIISKNFKPEQKVVLKGIATQPSYGGELVKTYANQIPPGMMQVKINGMLFKAKQISKPIRTKLGDVLDMFYKTKSGGVFWLQIGNLSKVENLPLRIVSDSTLEITDTPYCKVIFMPDGFLPTQLPNNYKGYEDKFGKSSILITRLKKFTFQGTIEFAGILQPNSKIKEENPDAQPIKLTDGRVDKFLWDEH
jgi:hypothetical protein